MKTQLEQRLMTGLGMEFRAIDDSTASFTGYATVYDLAYPVAGGPDMGGWNETVVSGAGTRTLNTKPDVRMLVNHEGLPIARTRSGTMQLEQDARGLIADAPALDLRNPKVQEVRSGLDRKDVDEMSFAFRVTRQEWNADYTERFILEYDLNIRGSDMSIVTWGANPGTVAQLRAAALIDEQRTAAPVAAMSLAQMRAIATQISVHA